MLRVIPTVSCEFFFKCIKDKISNKDWDAKHRILVPSKNA